jgi:cytochrome c-type biogenesis protein CcmH
VIAVKAFYAAMLAIMLLAPSASWAVQPDEMLPDPILEARARALSKELRCMVCQNESIDDSEAPLAHDFLVARYGEFVLLKPPLSWHTVALWGLPPAVLLIGAGVIIADLRRRRRLNSMDEEASKLSAAEESRLAELLRDNSAS